MKREVFLGFQVWSIDQQICVRQEIGTVGIAPEAFQSTASEEHSRKAERLGSPKQSCYSHRLLGGLATQDAQAINAADSGFEVAEKSFDKHKNSAFVSEIGLVGASRATDRAALYPDGVAQARPHHPGSFEKGA